MTADWDITSLCATCKMWFTLFLEWPTYQQKQLSDFQSTADLQETLYRDFADFNDKTDVTDYKQMYHFSHRGHRGHGEISVSESTFAQSGYRYKEIQNIYNILFVVKNE